MKDSKSDLTRDEELKLIRETLDKADLAFVSTLHEGKIVSRPLTVQKAEDFSLWFLVQKDSSFARQVAQNPTVNVALKGKSYLSVSGRAVIVPNQGIKSELWDKATEKFFGAGESDPSIIVVQVTADSAEYWEADGFLKPLFNFLANEAGEGEADVGDRNKVDL